LTYRRVSAQPDWRCRSEEETWRGEVGGAWLKSSDESAKEGNLVDLSPEDFLRVVVQLGFERVEDGSGRLKKMAKARSRRS